MTRVLTAPAVRGSAPVHQGFRVIMLLEHAKENALQVIMERTAIRVGVPTEVTLLVLVCLQSASSRVNLSCLTTSDCPEGKFGPGCVHTCNCTGAPCDRVTGQCKCPAGTSGKHCESCECKRYYPNILLHNYTLKISSQQ